MKDVLGNHLKVQSFRLVHWWSVTLFLRKTSQESINLEGKSYPDCSLDTLCTRGEFGRVTKWLQTLRSWKRWTHQKPTKKKTQCKGGDISQRRWKIYFPIADGRIKPLGGDQDLRTSTSVWHRPIQAEGHVDFLGESEGSPPPPRLTSGCRWSNKWLLVHVRKLLIPPSRWTQSQTLLAERRIIPYSTEIHWCIQNYKNKFGCYARTPHRWLLEYRWIKRFVRFLGRFHSVSSIDERPSDGYMWSGRKLTKRQATSRPDQLWPELWIKMGKMLSWRRDKWSDEKPKLDNARRLRGIYLSDPEDKEINETIKNARKKLETSMAPAMPCKTCKKSKNGETRGKTNDFKSKFACFLEGSESTRLRMEESLPNYHEDHIAGRGNNLLQHHNLVHKFIPVPQAMKIPAAKSNSGINNGKNLKRFQRGTWQKSEVNQRWSIELYSEAILWKMILDLMQYLQSKDPLHHKWQQLRSWISFPDCQDAQDKQRTQYPLVPR